MSNTVKADNGSEIYLDRFFEIADDYINALNNPDDLYGSKGNCFTGMIKYISIHLMRKNKDNICANLDALNKIWDMYTILTYRYNQKPYIEEFAILLGISRDTIYSWGNGETRADYSEELGSSRSDTVKKWQEECQTGRRKGASAGSIGDIFLCKAVDGMVETAPAQVPYSGDQRQSLEEIQHRYISENREESTRISRLPDADFS